MIEGISVTLVVLGVLMIFIANLGILLLPDLFCRAHALSKASTLGISLLLIGLWTHLGNEAVGFKILLTIFFQFITIPVSSHLFIFFASRHRLDKFP